MNSDEIMQIYNCKSGKIAEKFIALILDKYCCCHSSQFKYSTTFKLNDITSFTKVANFDILSNDVIIEIKNYMYNSTGTANEKLECDIIKYESFITQKKFSNMIFILCAKFETLFMTKHINTLMLNGYLNNWFDEGIYITLLSDIINDFLYVKNMSFIKWVGGKTKLMNYINKYIEKYINENKDSSCVYIEPFLGSGSVLINILTNYSSHFKSYICSDNNKVLIDTFKEIQNNHESLTHFLKLIQNKHDTLLFNGQKEFYYGCRDMYNELINDNININENDYINDFINYISTDESNTTINNSKYTLTTLISSLFIYLNKTCFRGLYRVNKQNKFNVPYGNYKNPSIINVNQIKYLHTLFSQNNVSFIRSSYESINIPTKDKALIYLDPPYFNTFDSYTLEKFDNNKFVDFLISITKKDNLSVVLSNSLDFQKLIEENKLKLQHAENISINDRINSKQPDNKRFEIIASNIFPS